MDFRALRFHTAVFAPLLLLTACASTSSRHTLSNDEKIEGLFTIAAAAVSEKDPITAIETLNQIQALDDSLPREYFLYALAYLDKNELALAEKAARQALKLDPDYTAAKNALGKILLDQGRYSAAEPLLKAAAGDILFRDSALPKTNLGILYFKTGNLTEAETWLNRALEEKSRVSCLTRYFLGRVKLQKNELPLAARNLMLSVKEGCGTLSEAHLAYGQTLIRQKRFDEARTKFIEIQKLFPNSDVSDQADQYLKGIP